jgi:excisionase family DNA binding protein
MQLDRRECTRLRSSSENGNSTNSSQLLSIKECGAIIKLGPWCIRRLIYSGALPYVRIGRRVLIKLEDLERFIDANRHQECFHS